MTEAIKLNRAKHLTPGSYGVDGAELSTYFLFTGDKPISYAIRVLQRLKRIYGDVAIDQTGYEGEFLIVGKSPSEPERVIHESDFRTSERRK